MLLIPRINNVVYLTPEDLKEESREKEVKDVVPNDFEADALVWRQAHLVLYHDQRGLCKVLKTRI